MLDQAVRQLGARTCLRCRSLGIGERLNVGVSQYPDRTGVTSCQQPE
ncbi:hypothetical protein ACFXPA_46070 [Amycolatopsis sp. NPDC059090]